MIDFELKWSCRYCGKYHKNWVEVIDIPLSQKMNVKCKNCKMPHTLKVYNSSNWEVIVPHQPGVFLNLGIESFMNFMPTKFNLQENYHNKEIPFDTYVNRWCEHDALHFISGNTFDYEGECKVAFLEKVLNRGWIGYNDYINTAEPCDYDYITPELIDVFSGKIKELLG